MKRTLLLLLTLCASAAVMPAEKFTSTAPTDGLQIIADGKPLDVMCSENDYEGVRMAVANMQNDFLAVCGTKAELTTTPRRNVIIAGCMGSPLISQVLKRDAEIGRALEGKREKYILKIVDTPIEGVDRALVIAGSDKRGTIYGIYELCRQIGVSPWYWWADVPVKRHRNLWVKYGTYTDGEPKVFYRGIFINDEWPAFGGWAAEKFGGINSKCYEKIFELLLRLKANFLWPAMWSSAFYDDDKGNGPLADKMGIIMGTSHHEPMALAQQDWKRRKGHGAWSWLRNKDELLDFWRYGAERSRNWETMYTIGMRGDGDEAMEDKGSVAMMEDIVAHQRNVLEEAIGRQASDIPQTWALYKEVQDYYDKGIDIPEDVTLLLCDDNWGNVRRLPQIGSKIHKGGFGMYYHFDYVGAPRNSKWVNISPIPRVWEQMNLTYRHGVDKMWIVNVGDLKPMEYPIQFFLDMAWNPERFDADNLTQHSIDFCSSIFGEEHGEEAARILRTYAKYNRRVTPEQLDRNTYSFHYDEWRRVRNEYNALAEATEQLGRQLPGNLYDTWFELLGYPVLACSNLYNMYYAQAMNHRLAKKSHPETNLWADKVKEYYAKDSVLTRQYHAIAGGKWNKMMSQIHIGYTSWNNPQNAVMPEVKYIDAPISKAAGPEDDWTVNKEPAIPGSCGFLFAEKDGCVSIEAEHWTRSAGEWKVIPGLGRTLSAIETWQQTRKPDGDYVEYDFITTSAAHTSITIRLAPTLNYCGGQHLAVSLDGGCEKILDINSTYRGELGEWQRGHVIDLQTVFNIATAGKHTLRLRPVDAGIVIEKIIMDLGGLHKSFLGPQETLAAPPHAESRQEKNR